ncbi:hypothetical protein Y1Q_0014964 [Alligator mississippiensis]|uniref:Uncharacterized protein n=1 Tax=Alligator mississippiensis TaxID=8496 RepID=A0A151N8M9_ALLMI|nr:hypothetical protein Y1Q_0014964 [Alligator mississippiensis]
MRIAPPRRGVTAKRRGVVRFQRLADRALNLALTGQSVAPVASLSQRSCQIQSRSPRTIGTSIGSCCSATRGEPEEDQAVCRNRREADVRDRRQSQLRGGSFAESQAEAFCASYNGSLPSSLERQKTKLIDYIGLCQHRCMEWQPGGPATQQI